MKTMTAAVIGLGVSIAFSLAGPDSALAQDYPARRITLLVGYATGGPTDLVARIVADRLKDRLGQPVIVENRIGGGPILSFDSVKSARPDGYMLAMGTSGLVSLKFTSQAFTLDPLQDFSYIVQLTTAQYPQLLLASTTAPFRSLQEFVAYARANPGKVNFGSAGTSVDLDIGLLTSTAGFKVTSIPYKGSGPQQLALMAGEIDVGIDGYGVSRPNIDSGKIRILAVGSPQRIPPFPDTPAIAESVPGYNLSVGWLGIIGPPALPADIVARLNEALHAVLRDADVRDRLRSAAAVVPSPGTPAEFRALVEREFERIAKAASVSGIRPR